MRSRAAPEIIMIRVFAGAGQVAPVHGFPVFLQIRKHLVVAATEDLFLIKLIVFGPESVDREITYFTVEHRQYRRAVLEEQAESRYVFDFGQAVAFCPEPQIAVGDGLRRCG